MNLTTQFKKVWNGFDKYVKMIFICLFAINVLNITGLFFDDLSLAQTIINGLMLVLVGIEGIFVYKEIQFLKDKQKLKEL